MYGLAVNLIVSVSGHPWIIDEMLMQFLPETIKKEPCHYFSYMAITVRLPDFTYPKIDLIWKTCIR